MRIAATAIVYNKDPEFKHLTRMLASTEAVGTTDYVLGIDAKSIEGTREFIMKTLEGKSAVL